MCLLMKQAVTRLQPWPERSRFYTFYVATALNLPALKMLKNVIADPSIAVPALELGRLNELNTTYLQSRGVKCIVFDKDNTLCYTYGNEMHHTAREAVDRSRTVFGAHALSILSNSAGTSDDVDHRMALETEAALGLPVIRHRAKKPDCLDEVLKHCEASLGEKVTPPQICVIGDRLLTDVVFANHHGMVSVLVAPLSYTKDHPIAVVLRLMERGILLPLIKGLGYRPPTTGNS